MEKGIFKIEIAAQRTGREKCRPVTQEECDRVYGVKRARAESTLYHPDYGYVRSDSFDPEIIEVRWWHESADEQRKSYCASYLSACDTYEKERVEELSVQKAEQFDNQISEIRDKWALEFYGIKYFEHEPTQADAQEIVDRHFTGY